MMTVIGIVAGDILDLLEHNSGLSTVTEIKEHLNYPDEMIYMAVGSLVRSGYVRMTAAGSEQYLSAVPEFETTPFAGTFGEIAYAP